MDWGNKTLLVIVGPTAVGKTELCVQLAQELKTEIISADSRQFYKELSIGTAKPSLKEQGGINHHFIDSHSIHDYFSPGDFEREALLCLKFLFEQHDVVIATGGSGLYLKALVDGLDEMPDINMELRNSLMSRLQTLGLDPLLDELRKLDPEYADQVDVKNPQRVIRALEVCMSSSKTYSEFRKNKSDSRPFKILKYCLDRPREELYQRIDARMDAMLAEGLVDEAKKYVDFQANYALKTLGYKEVYGYLRQEYDETELTRLLKRNGRHYAKKQLTWFRHQDKYVWLHPFEAKDLILKDLKR
jgi:tRNA dimethylallyltransferase